MVHTKGGLCGLLGPAFGLGRCSWKRNYDVYLTFCDTRAAQLSCYEVDGLSERQEITALHFKATQVSSSSGQPEN